MLEIGFVKKSKLCVFIKFLTHAIQVHLNKLESHEKDSLHVK